jgi:hypothetical protein
MKKSLPLIALAALSLFAGCSTPNSSTYGYDHWSGRSVGPRMERNFVHYDPARDGTYGNRLHKDGSDFMLTFERHFLNSNPDNPFQHRNDPAVYGDDH